MLNKYKSMNIVMKATLWYLICNIIQKGIQFFTIPLYIRLLVTEQYGNYSVFMSWKDILIIPITMNLYCGIFTKAMVDYENDRDRYTSSMQGLGTVITLFFFLLFFYFNKFFLQLLGYNKSIISLLFLYYISFPAYSFWTVRQRVEYRYKRMVFLTIIISILTPTISILLFLMTNLNEEAIIIGTLIVPVVCGLYLYINHFRKDHTFYHREYWIQAVTYNMPLIPHYLSLIVLSQSDRIMIKHMCGADKAGIYTLAYQISAMINIIVTSVNNAMIPWLYGKIKKRQLNDIKRVAFILCICMGIISILAMLLAPEIVFIIGTKEYYEAIRIIPVIVMSAYLSFCSVFFTAVEFYYAFTQYVMIASLIGAVVNIVLNYFCIPRYGYIAAGYTTLACYMLFYFMHYHYMNKICKNKMQGMRIYYNEGIMLVVGIIFSLMFLCIAIYTYTIVRYVICICILTSALLSKKKIMNLLEI